MNNQLIDQSMAITIQCNKLCLKNKKHQKKYVVGYLLSFIDPGKYEHRGFSFLLQSKCESIRANSIRKHRGSFWK